MPLDSTRIVYEPPAGKAVEAPWGVGVARGIVQHFDSIANRDAMWHTPIQHGAMASTVADDKLWYYNGSAWVEVAMLTRDVSVMMPKSGGTFTNDVVWDNDAAATFYYSVNLRRAGNAPFLEFQNSTTTGTPATYARLGYIQCSAPAMSFNLQAIAGYFSFVNSRINSAGNPPREIARISDDGLHVNPITATKPGIYSSSPIQVGGDGPQLRVVDTNTATGTADAYIGFYTKGTVTSPGAMGGWVGYSNSGHLQLSTSVASGQLILIAKGANSDIQINTVRSILFYTASTFRGSVVGNHFLWGKSASDSANAGSELWGTLSGHEGMVMSTNGTAGSTNFYAKHIGSASAANQYFLHCYNAAGGPLGGIYQTATGVELAKTSDRRLKHVLGPVTDGVERIKRLQPHRVVYLDDPDQTEMDALIADEVQDVMPELVAGEPDAVAPTPTTDLDPEEGTVVPQTLAYGGFTTVMIAALQELINRVEALEAA